VHSQPAGYSPLAPGRNNESCRPGGRWLATDGDLLGDLVMAGLLIVWQLHLRAHADAAGPQLRSYQWPLPLWSNGVPDPPTRSSAPHDKREGAIGHIIGARVNESRKHGLPRNIDFVVSQQYDRLVFQQLAISGLTLIENVLGGAADTELRTMDRLRRRCDRHPHGQKSCANGDAEDDCGLARHHG